MCSRRIKVAMVFDALPLSSLIIIILIITELIKLGSLQQEERAAAGTVELWMRAEKVAHCWEP